MEKLDKKDWQILELLCKNARLSHKQIGRKVKLSKNAVNYRIERLKKKGIISGFFTVIDFSFFDISFYELLISVNGSQEEIEIFVEFLKKHPNVLVLDKLSGEWDFVLELGCKTVQDFFKFIKLMENRFSTLIYNYEAHPILKVYKIEQLPKTSKFLETPPTLKQETRKIEKKKIKIDHTDKKLLLELNKNSVAPLYELGEKLGVTYETVSSRIKKLKERGIILKFVPKIVLRSLGYDTFLIITDLRNLSQEKEKKLESYILVNKKIRYCFMSASKPQLFIYFAAKNSDELDLFMADMKKSFSQEILHQRFLLSKEQYKYELFTEALL